MNETTQNFLEVFNNLEPWTLPVLLFRLYYDDQGRPIEYSHEDKPGKYIKVDPVTFQIHAINICIIDGKIVQIVPPQTVTKLVPSTVDGICCNPKDVCVVVAEDQPHVKWNLETNETN
jgi:hypothetical protein